MERWIRTNADLEAAITLIRARMRDGWVKVDIADKGRRSIGANRSIHAVYQRIADARGDVVREEVEAESKLTYGVPIMREDEDFRTAWDATIGKLSYEDALQAMTAMDVPVTRLMNKQQFERYARAVVGDGRRNGLLAGDET